MDKSARMQVSVSERRSDKPAFANQVAKMAQQSHEVVTDSLR
jgi:hypothetical protein